MVGASAGNVEGVQALWNGWSGLRIWDYSDPADPVLASTFDTACSALEPGTEGAEDCIEGGLYVLKAYGQGSSKIGTAAHGG